MQNAHAVTLQFIDTNRFDGIGFKLSVAEKGMVSGNRFDDIALLIRIEIFVETYIECSM